MLQLLWLTLAWIGGALAILGSLMFVGSLVLWVAPPQAPKAKRADAQPSQKLFQAWQYRLKLTAFAIATALVGFSLLIVFPFPLNISSQ